MAQETPTRWKGTFAAMLAGGAVGIFLAPVVTPALGRMMRPATKTMIKAGMAIYARGRETVAELRETVEDVTAEIAAEAAAAEPAEAEAAPGSATAQSFTTEAEPLDGLPSEMSDVAAPAAAPARVRARTAVH